MHRFIEDAPSALALLDCDRRYVSVSRRWLEDYELAGCDIHGKSHDDLFPDISVSWRAVHRRVLAGEVLSSNEDEIVWADGRSQWIKWEAQPWRTADGAIGGVTLFTEDITGRKKAELIAADLQSFLRATIDASPVAVVTTDEQGKILTFSREAESIFGYREGDVQGVNVNILMPEPDHSQHDLHLKNYLTSGQKNIIGSARTITARRKNGETFPARLHVSEFIDGRTIFVGYIEDVTHQAATERRLSETSMQLQHAGRLGALGEMTTAIAHEINQPLTAAASLAGAAAMMLRKSDTPDLNEATPLIDDAINEIRRASEIIRQMRDFVKKRKTAHSRHDVNSVVADACSIALIGAESEGVKVEVDLGPDVGFADIDRIQIQQVVTNLVRNAIDAMKGMQSSRLTISTARVADMIEISVADTGIGVSDERKSDIFDPFVSDKDDGVGVGLAITKAIVDAHQGEISITDNTPAGAVFCVTLPIGKPMK